MGVEVLRKMGSGDDLRMGDGGNEDSMWWELKGGENDGG